MKTVYIYTDKDAGIDEDGNEIPEFEFNGAKSYHYDEYRYYFEVESEFNGKKYLGMIPIHRITSIIVEEDIDDQGLLSTGVHEEVVKYAAEH